MAIKFIYTGSYVPTNIHPDAQTYFDACDTAGYPVSEAYQTYYNAMIQALDDEGIWDELDSLFIDATGDKEWAKIDVRTPTRTATINNAYAGDWTAGTGWKGNGSNFSILTNFNPGDGGSYNFTRDDASIGVLVVDNTSTQSSHDISCCNAGYTQGILIRAYVESGLTRGAGAINSGLFTSNTYQKAIFNSYAWLGMHRTASGTANCYYNGVNIESISGASTALENKAVGRFGAYNGSFTGGFYSTNRQAAFYAGGGTINQTTLINCLNVNFFIPQATAAALDKRVIFEGDSRSGDIANYSLSNSAAMPKRVLTNLGSGWCGVTVATANNTVNTMVTEYATEIEPYRNATLNRDVLVLWAGTNDIAAGTSAADIKDDIEALGQAAKDDGFFVVVVGEIDRNWSSYAAMNTVRSTLRTNMLADFSAATAETNVYEPPAFGVSYADLYIDLFADTSFTDYTDTTYYQVDGIHPNTTGSQLIGDYVSAAIALL